MSQCIGMYQKGVSMTESLLRINEAVRVTCISRNTLYRYMRDGKLTYVERNGVRYLKRSEINAITPTDLAQQDFFSSKSDTQKVTGDTPSNAELCAEIKELRNTITHLTKALVTLGDTVTRIGDVTVPVIVPKKSTPVKGDNERRAEEAQSKVFKVLEKYKDADTLPSITAMATEADVNRGTFARHQKAWDAQSS